MTYKERLELLKEKAEALGMDLNYEPEVKGVFPVQDEEWLKARKEGIGGSEAGTILGINHYQTPHQLALEKLSESVDREIDPDTQYTLNFGHVLEKFMLDLYAAKTGFKVWQCNNTQCNDRTRNGEGLLFPWFAIAECDHFLAVCIRLRNDVHIDQRCQKIHDNDRVAEGVGRASEQTEHTAQNTDQ